MKDYREQLSNIRKELDEEDFEKEKEKYPKKNFEELIDCLCQKGVKFEILSKDEALKILHDLNYYYKLTVYKRNFRKDKEGNWIDLEFSYLVDLASIDMQLRYLLLAATLDIEHALKTFLVTQITKNQDVDGYDIVKRFFHSTTESLKPLSRDTILKSTQHNSHYQNSLYHAHKNAISAWVLVEVVGFGDFLRFFEFYFKKYPCTEFKIDSLMGSLYGVKSIRNASAHSNPFLFDLASVELNTVNKELKKYAEERGIGEMFYKCLKVHDILSVFYIHEKFVLGSGSRKHRVSEFKLLIEKSKKRFTYMEARKDIVYFFEIINKVLDKYIIQE